MRVFLAAQHADHVEHARLACPGELEVLTLCENFWIGLGKKVSNLWGLSVHPNDLGPPDVHPIVHLIVHPKVPVIPVLIGESGGQFFGPPVCLVLQSDPHSTPARCM